uniref:NYN domain-containing protein n=1 Tax=Paractinoplanes polyasparticus TaxID=2856853 RepID=UPI001C8536BE|nr:NYN domain-containing protein [Actinoplanes polyasparticus]
MEHVRAALYLDFDNVFSGLYKIDPDVAIQFANQPKIWLDRLAATFSPEAPRRWLVLRCYLNPAGSVAHTDPASDQTRLYFSKFRPGFVRAGFEVIDCPRYSGTKNAADIRIVVDAVDALSADTRYDEFVIASGDSDMTPLLQRLRRSDRRTMIVSPADAAEAFTTIADQVLDSQRVLALVQGESVDIDDEPDDVSAAELEGDFGVALDRDLDARQDADSRRSAAYEAFQSMVTDEYQQAAEPVNMASLAHRIRAQLGSVVSESNWFGFGSFARAVASLHLANLNISQHLLWDADRHSQPESEGGMPRRTGLPPAVERVTDQLNLPTLPQPSWPAVYRVLSDYAHTHAFNLTHCTSWARDQLREQGFGVSRSAVAFVVRGCSYGGAPLHRKPAPTAIEIGEAFIDNVISRAEAEFVLSDDEKTTIRGWLDVEREDWPSADSTTLGSSMT